MKNGSHSNVGFASSRGGTNQEVDVAVECRLVDFALYAVQGPGTSIGKQDIKKSPVKRCQKRDSNHGLLWILVSVSPVRYDRDEGGKWGTRNAKGKGRTSQLRWLTIGTKIRTPQHQGFPRDSST
jgi:hypothetical protein